MTLSPNKCLAAIALFITFQSSAQSTLIKKGSNGKLVYSYNINIDNSSKKYAVQIVYKNEQIIYKEEVDTITLHNPTELNDFASSLQKTIESLSDEKVSVYLEKPTYSLFKFDKGVIGTFVSISNPSGNIVSNNTKAQAMDLLNWVKTIEFGKE
jgi:hypothetical protein